MDYKREKRTEHPALLQRLLWALERRYYERAERRILRESDAVICVSARLRDVMVDRFALPPGAGERNCTSSPRWPAARSSSSTPSGGSGPAATWDSRTASSSSTAATCGAAGRSPSGWSRRSSPSGEVRPNAFFLVLTREADRGFLQPLLDRAGVGAGDVRMLTCPHEQVVDHLCAGDVGLLLRERHPMNEVAAPGKFAEYVLSGLPIVMTEGIGDFSAPMREADLACVLPDLDDAEDLRARLQHFCARDFGAEQRAAFGAWAAERFAVELAVPRMAALYRTV